ncbi:MAG: hypothetical protein KME37_07700 [Candidatus Thiodiazotropha sp. (ex Codakia orbicularis)]|nr:hypothetical protein [Candidatus Thiodiazotropha sp. (ex Codakia orbicularis)]
MSGGGGTQRTTTEPYDEQMPYIQDIFRQSQMLSNEFTPYYPGMTYAPSNQLHDLGFGGQMGVANQYGGLLNQAGQNVFGMANQATNNITPTPTVDPTQRLTQNLTGQVDTSPYDAVAQAMRRQMTDYVNEQVGANDQMAAMMGRSGSGRHALVERGIRSDANQQLQDAMANMYLNAYEGAQTRAGQGVNQAIDLYGRSALADSQRLNTAANLYGMVPQFGQSQLQFAGVPLAAGDFYRQEQQLGIDDAMDRYNYEVEQPWSNLERYANLVYGSPGGTTSTMRGGGNRMGSILGGGLTGLGLASQFAGAGGLGSLGLAGAAPWALGGMAIAGLLDR